jgi:C1A family cysteine protease
MKKFLILIALLITTPIIKSDANMIETILDLVKDSTTEDQFKVFHHLFKKEYDLNSAEGQKRYEIFQNSLQYIKTENSKGNTYTLGINQFADLTNTEFTRMYFGVQDEPSNAQNRDEKETDYFDKYADADDAQDIKPEYFEKHTDSDDKQEKTDYFDKYADADDAQDDKSDISVQKPANYEKNLGLGDETDKTDFFDKYADADDASLRLLKQKNFLHSDDDEDADEIKLKAKSKERTGKVLHETGMIVDWKGYFSEVKDQKSCSSGWAHSTAGAIEGNLNISSGLDKSKYKIFSPQELVDCIYTDSFGCNNGKLVDAFNYFKINGIFEESAYPYKGIAKTCAAKLINKRKTISKQIIKCPSNPCLFPLFIDLLKQGPISVGINSIEKLKLYKTGYFTFNDNECSQGGNHSLIVVGHEFDTSTGGHIFTVRNSWGVTWGEQGYAKILYNPNSRTNNCGLLFEAFLPLLH